MLQSLRFVLLPAIILAGLLVLQTAVYSLAARGNPPLLYDFHDNGQWHDDFAIDDLQGWILIDVDQLPTSGPFQTYPHKDEPMAFIVYNPSQTSPPNTFPEFQPRSGDKLFMSIGTMAAPPEDWMITRELAPHPGGEFAFWAKGTFSFFGDEQFKVAYSTGGSQPEDFVFFNNGNPYTANWVWTRYSFNIPPGVKHLAIVRVSYAYCFVLDDLSFTATVNSQAPAQAGGLQLQTEVGDQVQVHLSWTNPVTTSGGSPLGEITGISIYRGSHPMGFQPVAQLGPSGVGAEMSFTDSSVEPMQSYAWRVVAYNSHGAGKVLESGFINTGYDSTPGAPHTISIDRNAQNQTVISWNEVDYGASGGLLQDPVTGYTISRKAGDQTQVLAAMHPGTSFTENQAPDFNLYTYSVVAHTSPEISGPAGTKNGYSGMSPDQFPVTFGNTASEQVFELTRSSILSQSLYMGAEMGESGLITGLSYFSNLGAHAGSHTYKIYMSATNRSNFGPNNNNAVWEYFGNQKLVFEGPVSFEGGPRAIEIALDQPFFHDAESGKNVIITVIKPITSNIPQVSPRIFYNTPVDAMRTYYAIGYGIDMASITTQPAVWATEEVGTIPSIVTSKEVNYASLSGMVSLAGTQEALPGVSLQITPAPGSEAFQQESIISGTGGSYHFEALLPGHYLLHLNKEGLNPLSLEVSLVQAQQLSLDLEMTATDPVIISGQIINEASEGIEGARLQLGGYSGQTAYSGPQGHFSLNGFAQQSYHLTVSHPLYIETAIEFETPETDLVLDPIALAIQPIRPKGVQASIESESGQISWEVPYGLDNESWLAWGSLTNVLNGWGAGGAEFIAATRFNPTDLATLLPENAHLTHVRAYLHNHADIEIRIYEGNNAATLLYTENHSITQAGWYEFELEQSIEIDPEKDFWIGLRFLPGYGAYPIGIDEGPSAPARKGGMLYQDGSWTPMSLTNKNWNIYGIVHSPVPAQPEGYMVYRGISGTDTSNWQLLTSQPVTSTDLTDTGLADQYPAVYRYGVKAVYGAELESAISLSNEVAFNMLFDLVIELNRMPSRPEKNSDHQAWVRLQNQEHYREAHILPGQNQAVFENVWRGTYALSVRLDNYEPYEESVLVEETGSHAVDLNELLLPPSGLKAGETEDGSVRLSWSLHGSFLDEMETYADFEKVRIGPYILRDLDGLPTYTYTNFTWPDAGSPMAFMVFNPWATVPAITLQPASGRRFLVAMAGPDGPNNDWLIIPARPGEFGFMARSLVADYPESMRVLYSTTGTQAADFTPLPGGSQITPDAYWNAYSFQAPENTAYLAIHYNANDTYFLLIDDLYYQRPYQHALGYNVYLNGVLIAENLPDTEILFTLVRDELNLAEVEAVYASGISERAWIEFEMPVSAVISDNKHPVRVYPNPSVSHLIIESEQAGQLNLVNAKGQQLLNQAFYPGLTRINHQLPNGIYLLSITTANGLHQQKLIIQNP